jgi:hypothetical protein
MTSAPKIPKSFGKNWVSLDDPHFFPMTLLTIDVERVFVRFLELGVRYGLITRPMDETSVEEYEKLFLESLTDDLRIVGLTRSERRRVLDGWLRSTVLKFESRGEGKKDGRRLAVPRPLHLGVIRSGLPSKTEYLIRYTDVWSYYTAVRALGSEQSYPAVFLDRLLRQTLGKGMKLSELEFHSDEPRYDEVTPIDVNSLVALRLLSRFTSARPDDSPEVDQEMWPDRPWVNTRRYMSKRRVGFPSAQVFDGGGNMQDLEQLVATPTAFEDIGRDLVEILSCYGHLDGTELTQHCLALLSFRLFRAPLLAAPLVRALANGVSHDLELGNSVKGGEIYCDFSDGRDVESVKLAKRCVERDLEVHRIFFRDRLYFRVLDYLARLQDADTQAELKKVRSKSLWDYYRLLSDLRPSVAMSVVARITLQQFQSAVQPADGEQGQDLEEESNVKWRECLEEWEAEGVDPISQLVRIMLVAARPGGRAPAQMEQWCWTTGGMLNQIPHRPFALLAGSVKHRSTWRYAPTDQLLTALLLGCFVSGRTGSAASTPEMRFGELLDVLRNRYGITIDRPPAEFADADTSRTAERNRSYFARKLQLLGCFDGLSDDSQFQMVRRPR